MIEEPCETQARTMKVNAVDTELLASFAEATRDAGAIIERIESASWLPDLRRRLPRPYPSLFDSFLSSYSFMPFEFCGVSFYANTGEHDDDELGNAVFRDLGIFEGTAPYGFLQFARPVGGSYDPICFNLHRLASDDAPIVRLDHEAILCDFAIKIEDEIAPSFRQFMKCA